MATAGNGFGNFRAGNHHWDSSGKAEGKAKGKAKGKAEGKPKGKLKGKLRENWEAKTWR